MSESNLKLWDGFSKTDPLYTKSGAKDGYKFTSIAPMYQIMQATKAFGPQGLGWGIAPQSERFTEQQIGDTTLLHYDATLFFMVDGQRGEIPIHASEKMAYITLKGKGYLKIDDEARKKVVTKAKTKGLSELGMCSDIFLGQFDNYEYLEARKAEAEVERAEQYAGEKLDQNLKYKESIEGALRMINEAVSMNMLEKAYKQAVIKAKSRGDEAAQIKLSKATEAKKKELEEVKHDKAV